MSLLGLYRISITIFSVRLEGLPSKEWNRKLLGLLKSVAVIQIILCENQLCFVNQTCTKQISSSSFSKTSKQSTYKLERQNFRTGRRIAPKFGTHVPIDTLTLIG